MRVQEALRRRPLKILTQNSFPFTRQCSLLDSSESTGSYCHDRSMLSLLSHYPPHSHSPLWLRAPRAQQAGPASRPQHLLLPPLGCFCRNSPLASFKSLPSPRGHLHPFYLKSHLSQPSHTHVLFLHCIYPLLKSWEMTSWTLLSLSPLDCKLQEDRDFRLLCSLLYP